MLSDLHYQPLTKMAKRIETGEISPVELTEALLSRIEAKDGALKSYTTVTAELALFQARRADDEIKKGRMVFPPHGEFEVALTLADHSLYPERGIVNFASPSYSEKTGTLTVRAVLANTQNIVRPGQFVRVKVHGAVRPQAIAVPQEAVQQGLKGSFVFVVQEGKAQVRPVVPGPWTGDEWIIWEGLEPGDRVIVDGVNRVAPGSPVHDL